MHYLQLAYRFLRNHFGAPPPHSSKICQSAVCFGLPPFIILSPRLSFISRLKAKHRAHLPIDQDIFVAFFGYPWHSYRIETPCFDAFDPKLIGLSLQFEFSLKKVIQIPKKTGYYLRSTATVMRRLRSTDQSILEDRDSVNAT